jgi:hypothetical protein
MSEVTDLDFFYGVLSAITWTTTQLPDASVYPYLSRLSYAVDLLFCRCHFALG